MAIFAATSIEMTVPLMPRAAAAAGCPGMSPQVTKVQTADFATQPGQPIPRPVVLVHGWDASASSMKPLQSWLNHARSLKYPVRAYLFDYGQNSARWAANRAIAACLADYLHQVSSAYRTAGGDGKILAVGHSMGGLALRFATSQNYTALPAADVVAGVVTIDTPHLGSPWGATGSASLIEIKTHGVQGLFPTPGSDGGTCLAAHTGDRGMPAGCATPTWFPASVSVAEIAGDITMHRDFMGYELYSRDTAGDAVVPNKSSLGYLPSSGAGSAPPGTPAPTTYTVRCDVGTGQVTTGVGGYVQGLGRGVVSLLMSGITLGDSTTLNSDQVELLGLIDLASECGHTNIENPDKNPIAASYVDKALDADLRRLGATYAPFVDDNVVTFDGIGALSLGMTTAQLIAMGYHNNGNSYEGMNAPCVAYVKGNSSWVSVDSQAGKVVGIRPSTSNPKTQVGGIGAGSTLAQLRRAFASMTITSHFNRDFGQGSDGVVVSNGAAEIGFLLASASDADYLSGAASVRGITGVGTPGNVPTEMETGC